MSLIEFKTDLTHKQLRQFAWLLFPVFGGLLGWLFYTRWGLPPVAYGVWSLVGVTAIMGIVSPEWVRPVFILLMCLAFPIGFVLSILVLSVVYYIVITPIGFLMRNLHKDPMQRRLDPEAETYWKERPGDVDPARYFRQF